MNDEEGDGNLWERLESLYALQATRLKEEMLLDRDLQTLSSLSSLRCKSRGPRYTLHGFKTHSNIVSMHGNPAGQMTRNLDCELCLSSNEAPHYRENREPKLVECFICSQVANDATTTKNIKKYVTVRLAPRDNATVRVRAHNPLTAVGTRLLVSSVLIHPGLRLESSSDTTKCIYIPSTCFQAPVNIIHRQGDPFFDLKLMQMPLAPQNKCSLVFRLSKDQSEKLDFGNWPGEVQSEQLGVKIVSKTLQHEVSLTGANWKNNSLYMSMGLHKSRDPYLRSNSAVFCEFSILGETYLSFIYHACMVEQLRSIIESSTPCTPTLANAMFHQRDRLVRKEARKRLSYLLQGIQDHERSQLQERHEHDRAAMLQNRWDSHCRDIKNLEHFMKTLRSIVGGITLNL